MTPADGLALVGCFIGAALGVAGLLNPGWASRLVRLSPTDGSKEGRSELRATFGGLFAFGHGGAALALVRDYPGAETGLLVLGLGWFGSGVGRTYSILRDGTGTRLNAFNVAFEIALAALLAASAVFNGTAS